MDAIEEGRRLRGREGADRPVVVSFFCLKFSFFFLRT